MDEIGQMGEIVGGALRGISTIRGQLILNGTPRRERGSLSSSYLLDHHRGRSL